MMGGTKVRKQAISSSPRLVVLPPNAHKEISTPGLFSVLRHKTDTNIYFLLSSLNVRGIYLISYI